MLLAIARLPVLYNQRLTLRRPAATKPRLQMAFFVDGVPVAMPPPEGYVVDFANPQRNSVTEAYWLYAVGNALALLMMGQRFYVRAVIQKKVFLEDGQFSSCSEHGKTTNLWISFSLPRNRLRELNRYHGFWCSSNIRDR